jgi:hypothetical protein
VNQWKKRRILLEFARRIIRNRFLPISLELITLLFCGYCLWYKVLLPEVYFLSAIVLAVLMVVQLVNKKYSMLLILQIAILGLFLRNVYSLNTNYSIVPFDDGNWDYAVVNTFKEYGRIYVINGTSSPVKLMEWYSEWPLLHIFATLFSEISGINTFCSVLLIPFLISILCFLFVFLLVEKLRKMSSLPKLITPLVLLIYVLAAESIFWPMQFVHQNIGILFLTIIIYFVCRLQIHYDRREVILTLIFVLSLVMSHAFTSFVGVGYLISLFFILFIWTSMRQRKTDAKSMRKHFLKALATISFVSFVFLFIWNENYGLGVWSYIEHGLNRFVELLLGTRKLEYLPTSVNYPSALTPPWAVILLTLRDFLIYAPAIFGLFYALLRVKNLTHKLTLVSTALSFGLIFIIDSLFFRFEVFRVLVISMPIIALFGAISYLQLIRKSKGIQQIIAVSCIAPLVISSFVGLWGHQFAPIHLYNPSIDPIGVGERNYDFMRVKAFFDEKISVSDYQIILADDRNPLIYLVSPKYYYKIKQLQPMENFTLGSTDSILICSFKDLFMYSYYARAYSPLDTNEEANFVSLLLTQQLNEKNIVFDDGKYKFWVDG